MNHHDDMRTLKCPASPCESVESLSRYFMRIEMHLVEVSQTHVKADGCQHDHGSLADGNWQKLASDSADGLGKALRVLVHLGYSEDTHPT